MPRLPPSITRSVGDKIREPASLALTTPVMSSPPKVKTTIDQNFAPTVGAKAPANGISPPAVKEIADAIAAWIGLAFVCGC